MNEAAPELPRLLSPEQLADRWGFPAQTLREWCRRGRIPAVKLGTSWRIRETDAIEWLERQGTAGHGTSA